MQMMDLIENVPLLIVVGAIGLPIAVYVMLGVGERMLALLPGTFAKSLRPWVWLLIPLVLIVLILVYPLVSTVVTAFFSPDSSTYVGMDNFIWSFTGEMVGVIGNNLLWLVVFPVVTLVLALLAAIFFDKVRYEKLAMTLVILPTAISFTAGAVIWTHMYSFQPAGSTQVGTVNAVLTALVPGAEPVPWLQTPFVNNLALIAVAVWLSLGIATLILSAAVKNVAGELLEAARLDGAGELRVFFSVTLRSILPSVLVVITTEIIAALKVFDIVYVMTNGNLNTDVIANRMYNELFAANDLGHASAIAVILLIAALPVVFINVFQFRAEAHS